MTLEKIAGKGEITPSCCFMCAARVSGSEGDYCDPARLDESKPLFCFRDVKIGAGDLNAVVILRKKLLK